MKRSDLVSGIVFLIISAIIIWFALSIPIGSLTEPGPGFLPFWVGIILAFLSTIMLLEPILRKQPPGKVQSMSPPTESIPASEEKESPKYVIMATASLVAYALLVEFLGFIISSLLLLVFYLRFIGKQKWWIVLCGSIVLTIACHFLFKVGLEVQLPRGLF